MFTKLAPSLVPVYVPWNRLIPDGKHATYCADKSALGWHPGRAFPAVIEIQNLWGRYRLNGFARDGSVCYYGHMIGRPDLAAPSIEIYDV